MKYCVVPKFIPDEFQKIKVITIKPQGINHALPVTLVYLITYTNHFLQGLEEDAESMELNMEKTKNQKTENKNREVRKRRALSQLGWAEMTLGQS